MTALPETRPVPCVGCPRATASYRAFANLDSPFGQGLAERAFDSSASSLKNIDIARKANVS